MRFLFTFLGQGHFVKKVHICPDNNFSQHLLKRLFLCFLYTLYKLHTINLKIIIIIIWNNSIYYVKRSQKDKIFRMYKKRKK